MTTTYTYSEARQNLASVLEEAERQGEVRIRRRNGRVFVIRPEKQRKRSPLDVKGVDTGIDASTIVEIVQEGRKRAT